MKTIGTKLDDEEFEEFLEIGNEEGCSKSEFLRKLLKDSIRERAEIIETEEESLPEPKVEIVKEQPMAQVTNWKLYDDDGRLVAQSR